MRTLIVFVLALCIAVPSIALAQPIDYLTQQPLADRVKGSLQPVSSGDLSAPIITWGADVQEILGNEEGIFAREGIPVKFFVENNFEAQVEACIAGKTPFVRGTMGMVKSAAEAFEQRGIKLVVIYQFSWSRGGDCIVVRDRVKTVADIKTIALQLYGPHMDYVLNIITNAGRSPSSVQFKWLADLSLPKGKPPTITNPVNAFENDPSIDAVPCISPDAAMLTDPKEGTVPGSRILMSTRTASRIIADVYAVRSDWYESHRDEVEKFVAACMKSQETLTDLMKAKGTKYGQTLSKSATMLFDSPSATADVEGLLGDCELTGYNANMQFFTGKGTTRTFATLSSEIQSAFTKIGLIKGSATLVNGNMDYAALAKGLKYATGVPAPAAAFSKEKVERFVASKVSGESSSWADAGTIFQTEIYFDPNQTDFDAAAYATDFDEARRKIETLGGALVVVEGHADPTGIAKAKSGGQNPVVIAQMEQDVKNKSYQRAKEVQKSFIAYCKKRGVTLDESRFTSVGMGIKAPKYAIPKTKEQWNQNRRVIFRVMSVEGESDTFVP
jgi:outer membrane protein OmpA-like peptidoglycan-associated protein/ABC-type nitrate/sulfonate/bicarbonate transport system substrate-binding protein